jgi:hypothetical protein
MVKNSKVRLQYSRNTVGCRIGKEIFIHPELYKHPKLYHAIILHEKKHSGNFSLKDLVLDLSNEELNNNKEEFYRFILTHPRTLLGYFPISKIGKHWTFDLEMLVIWITLIGVIWFIGVNL